MSRRITADTLSLAIGRPVRMFNRVCPNSGVYDRGVLDECAGIVNKHKGSILVAVHPGFYLQDKNKHNVIAGIGDRESKADMDRRYEAYRASFEALLLRTRIPLMLFIEKNKGLGNYSWVFDHSRSDLILVVETEKESPVPIISKENVDFLTSWKWISSSMKSDLGIRETLFAGEYLFVCGGGHLEGCVKGAYSAIVDGHVFGMIDTEVTFPNSPRKQSKML